MNAAGRRLLVGCLAAAMLASAAWAGDPLFREGDASAPSGTSKGLKVPMEELIQYYLRMYDKHLTSKDWITRAMATISLARLEDKRATERLFKIMTQDRMPAVRVYAWEALHSRLGLLDAAEHKRWLTAGMALCKQGLLRGTLRIGLTRALGAGGPTPQNVAFMGWLFDNTNSLNPADMPTLIAMRRVIGEWRHPQLTKQLILAMGKIDSAYRADFLLRAFDAQVQMVKDLKEMGSTAMFQKMQRDYAAWFQQANLQAATAGETVAYDGRRAFIKASDRLGGPDDPRWREDLELGKFRMKQLDVGLVVDSTGSMGPVIKWIRRDVGKLMRLFATISYEPRIGITFYRDARQAYVAKNIPLQSDARRLEAAADRETAFGGGDVPEAVLEGLAKAIGEQKWATADSARKVLILIGDAPPHAETMPQIQTLMAQALAKGFRVHCVKVHDLSKPKPDLGAFDEIAAWGKGHSIWADFLVTDVAETPQTKVLLLGVAKPPSATSGYRAIFREVLTDLLVSASAGYADRVGPFVNVLLECMEQYVPETRKPFVKTKQYEPPKQND